MVLKMKMMINFYMENEHQLLSHSIIATFMLFEIKVIINPFFFNPTLSFIKKKITWVLFFIAPNTMGTGTITPLQQFNL